MRHGSTRRAITWLVGRIDGRVLAVLGAVTALLFFGVLVGSEVRYRSSSAIVLINPPRPTGTEGDQDVKANPYARFHDLPTMAEILQRVLVSGARRQELADRGFDGTLEVSVNSDFYPSPILELSASGGDRGAAVRNLEALRSESGRVLDELQTEQGVPVGSRITVSNVVQGAVAVVDVVPLVKRSLMLLTAFVGAIVALQWAVKWRRGRAELSARSSASRTGR